MNDDDVGLGVTRAVLMKVRECQAKVRSGFVLVLYLSIYGTDDKSRVAMCDLGSAQLRSTFILPPNSTMAAGSRDRYALDLNDIFAFPDGDNIPLRPPNTEDGESWVMLLEVS